MLPAALRAFQCLKSFSLESWCTGEDSNLRSSKERQIYSLLPLTTRPPVPNFIPYTRRRKSAPEHRNCPCQSKPILRILPHPEFSGLSEHAPQWDHRGGQIQRLNNSNAGPNLLPFWAPEAISDEWSWRRDLNPRPSDYKSDALPAELRQPSLQIQKSTGFARSTPETYPRKPMESASTLPHHADHGTEVKISILPQAGQTVKRRCLAWVFERFNLTDEHGCGESCCKAKFARGKTK